MEKKINNQNKIDQMEQWLKDYFLNPQTQQEDYALFKLDIYEADEHWIVEVILNDYCCADIRVRLERSLLIITAEKQGYPPFRKERSIHFPFSIIHHDVTAAFQHGILEIIIPKRENGVGKDRYIPLP
ncbi:Hsp20/alpha crystallin family protein [Bacillus rubiinfantis]|uniref:Hsp20/alpha crystallin family protein n=1 Tax=Bacillus rubiinfantis TaxID=1499680 RepID=UPI0005A8969A|nr:Hsp20/alpha crystallin family protein [Bacillus rubiinfantis]